MHEAVCRTCGSYFETNKAYKDCSDHCRQMARRKYGRNYYYKHHGLLKTRQIQYYRNDPARVLLAGAKAGELFKDLLRTRLKKRPVKRGTEVLRFSSLGKKDRQLWYAANKPEAAEELPAKTLFKFLYGDVIEFLLLFLAKEAGHEVTHEQHEVEADGVLGHTDACIDGIPTDCKSASPYSFEKFKDGSFVFDDPFGYIPQLSGYAHALDHTDRAGFLVADKVHGGITWAEIDEYTIRESSAP
jgi:hypothetical protein